MTIRIEFNLPEEEYEFKGAINGDKYRSVLIDMDNHLRSKLKYSELTETKYDVYEEIRNKLNELINDEGLGDIHSE